MRTRKPEAGRVPYEDASAAAATPVLRGHLELEEIEAALGVYRQARQAIAGWRPPPPEWLELITGADQGPAVGRRRGAVAQLCRGGRGPIGQGPPQARPALGAEAGASRVP